MLLAFQRAARLAALIVLVITPAACGHVQDHVKVVVAVASATRNEPAAVLTSADLTAVRQAGATNTGAIAYVVDPNSGQPTTVPLTPHRPDGAVEYGPDRDTLLTANVKQVQRLLGRE